MDIDELKKVLDRVWKQENKLPEHLKDQIFLPNAKLRKTGVMKELLTWYIKGLDLLAKYTKDISIIPTGQTLESMVDYLIENKSSVMGVMEADIIMKRLREANMLVVKKNREKIVGGKKHEI